MIETSKEQGERWGGGYTLTPPDRFNAPYVHHLKQEDLGRHTVQLGKGRVVTESLKKKKKSVIFLSREKEAGSPVWCSPPRGVPVSLSMQGSAVCGGHNEDIPG